MGIAKQAFDILKNHVTHPGIAIHQDIAAIEQDIMNPIDTAKKDIKSVWHTAVHPIDAARAEAREIKQEIKAKVASVETKLEHKALSLLPAPMKEAFELAVHPEATMEQSFTNMIDSFFHMLEGITDSIGFTSASHFLQGVNSMLDSAIAPNTAAPSHKLNAPAPV